MIREMQPAIDRSGGAFRTVQFRLVPYRSISFRLISRAVIPKLHTCQLEPAQRVTDEDHSRVVDPGRPAPKLDTAPVWRRHASGHDIMWYLSLNGSSLRTIGHSGPEGTTYTSSGLPRGLAEGAPRPRAHQGVARMVLADGTELRVGRAFRDRLARLR